MVKAVYERHSSVAEPNVRRAIAREGRSKAIIRKHVLILTYVTPAMLGILLINVFPILYNVYMSFTNRNLFRFTPDKYEFIWFQNYLRLFGNLKSDFMVVMARTITWTVVCVFLFFIIGLILALLLNSPSVRARAIYRVLLIVPWAIPFYISALVWRFFFNGEFGTINAILRTIGWINPPAWLLRPHTAFGAVVITNIWMSYPFFMIVILGALQSIPQELYEAAEVDGASWWDKLTKITLPLIRPAVMPATILSSLVTFKVFESVWMITRGGPFTGQTGATEFVMLYAYRQAFQLFNFGYISAFAVVIFLILFGITLINLRFTRITRGAYE